MKSNAMTLDAFKDLLSSNDEVVDKIVGMVDIIDIPNGVMRIHIEHVNKYLEEYACKDVDDLLDTLYYNYGIFCEII